MSTLEIIGIIYLAFSYLFAMGSCIQADSPPLVYLVIIILAPVIPPITLGMLVQKHLES